MGFGGDVLVVRHGVIDALLLCAALDVPISRVWDFPQPSGAVKVLRLRWRAMSAEDMNHVSN